MKWTHTTGLLATFALIAAGGVWAGCSNNDGGNDGGTNDGGGNDVNQQKDTGGGDTGTTDSGGGDGGLGVDASALDCNYYCATINQVCTGTSTKQYLDNATCLAMCSNIPNDAGAGATSGNSLACRMYHLSVAAQSSGNADTHCPHAGPYGFGACGDLCHDFCAQDFATNGCGGNNYPNIDACHTYCAGAAGGDAGSGAPGNAATSPAMACREYHLEAAFGAPAVHCPHAGEDGGGVCP